MKKLTFILSILLFSYPLILISQEQANNWYFGEKTGLSFTNDCAEVLSTSSMIAEAGCSSISDKYGNLLFYTNGQKVWNNLHQIMPNGDSLKGFYGSNQNSLIIPKPTSENIYYLFTIDSSGFKYSIIDISMDNGLGDVLQKNIELTGYGNITDKITAIQHCNSIDTWVIVYDRSSAKFVAFLISAIGIDMTPTISPSGSLTLAEIGYMKVSPSGDKIILPINSSTILFEISDFDNKTGIISNPYRVFKSNETYAYGTAYSSDGKVLYVSVGGILYQLLQFDLTSTSETELNNSAKLIGQGNIYALQLSTDGKIYTACVNEPYVGIIHNPSIFGTDCIFENKAINLGNNICKMGLPNFNQSYFFKPRAICKNACTDKGTSFSYNYFSNFDSVYYNFGNDQTDISTFHPFYSENFYTEVGNYILEMIAYHCGTSDTIFQDIRINPLPKINLGNDTVIFEGNSIFLDAGAQMDEYIWNTGNNDRFLEVSNTGTYKVEVTHKTCAASDSIYIEVIPLKVELPTAFSPNNDNLNDIFKAIVYGSIQDFQFSIYNRYGEQVYYSTNYLDGWDGTYKGLKCPIDTYYWEILFSVPDYNHPLAKKINGYVNLLR